MSAFKFDSNSEIIIIPKGTKHIPDEAFVNFRNLREIILPESLESIGYSAFLGCTSLKKINLPNTIKSIQPYAFSNCKSLEEITIPSSLNHINLAVFSYCTNLKNISIHDNINFVDNYAFYNCRNLKSFNIPKNLNSLGYKALYGCNKIKEIHIPRNLDYIQVGALSCMSSLSKITVEDGNRTYKSDGLLLIDKNDCVIIQYAINSKNKEYRIDSNNTIYNICNYAFANSKHLEKLYIPSRIESIDSETFHNCNKLKNLNIYSTIDNKKLFFKLYNYLNDDCSIPFENIEIGEGIITLTEGMYTLFKNAKKVTLPSTLQTISNSVFNKSKKLENLNIPKNIKWISQETFYKDINLHFEDLREIRAESFSRLETKEIYNSDKITKIFSLNDGTYYIKIDDYDIIKITKNDINNFSKTSHILENSPDVFIKHLINLLSINLTNHNQLINVFNNSDLKKLFEKFFNDTNYVNDFNNKKIDNLINEIINLKNLDDEILLNANPMITLTKNNIIEILENYTPALERFFKLNGFFNTIYNQFNSILDTLYSLPELLSYTNLLEKYNIKDMFLYDTKYINYLDYEDQELLITNYNKHIKRLLIESDTLKNKDSFNDLIKFLKVLGVFDNKLNQKTSTFITEKLFSEILPNGEKNKYKISGDNIHRIFNELIPRNELDLEFILFFIENYKDLIIIEINTSGFISRTYNNFKEISKCSTSNRGDQKHLKVTLNKVKEYFLLENSFLYDENDIELTNLLCKYYNVKDTLSIAKSIINESKKAPRNIFSRIEIKENKIVYDNNHKNDLKGFVNGCFYYEWLPKQDYNNLVLGKYCNCCAHITGAGAGIMKASMVLDDCQNLIIRNDFGEIIAKMTIYVNRKLGYAVYNTIEVNLNYRDDNMLYKIYKTFIKGTEAFYKKYNKNNDIPITTITVGKKLNVLLDILINNNHKEIKPLDVIDYSNYSYTLEDNIRVGDYAGDARKEQILILSKKA